MQKVRNAEDIIADAFYDENWGKLSNIFGKKVKSHQEAELAFENWKKFKEREAKMWKKFNK